MTLNQNQVLNDDIDLTELLRLHEKSVKLGINCHAIGAVQSFNSVLQTATIKISYKRPLLERQANGTYAVKQQDYPLLLDCPVIFLGGGVANMRFPVTSGDNCLVLFNDRDINNWFSGNTDTQVASPRLHSLSDGIALVGIRPQNKVLQGFSGEAVEIYYGGNKIKLDATSAKIELSGGVSLEVNTSGKLVVTNLTGEFVAALIQALTTGTAGGFPFIIDPVALATLQSFQG